MDSHSPVFVLAHVGVPDDQRLRRVDGSRGYMDDDYTPFEADGKYRQAALSDRLEDLIKQSVKGIDTTTGATVTSEAIINATAKALAGAKKQ